MLSTEERRLCPPRPPHSLKTTTRSQTRTFPVLPVALLAIVAFVISSVSVVCAQKYVVPPAILEALSPRGLRVSIPDSPGVEIFAFHGSINKPMHALEAGDLSVDIVRKTGNRWVYLNDRVRLKLGDIIYYWTYVQVDGLGYRRDDQTWQVTGFVSASSPIGSSSSTSAGGDSGGGEFDSNSGSKGNTVNNPNINRPNGGTPYDIDTTGNSPVNSFGAPSSSTNLGSVNNEGGGSSSNFGGNGGGSRPTNNFGNNGDAGEFGNSGDSATFTGNNGGSRPSGNFDGNSGGSNRPTGNFGSNSGGSSRPTGNFGSNSGGSSRPTGNFGSNSGGSSRPTGNFGSNSGGSSRPSGNFGSNTEGSAGSRPTGNFGSNNGGSTGSRPSGNFGSTTVSGNNGGDYGGNTGGSRPTNNFGSGGSGSSGSSRPTGNFNNEGSTDEYVNSGNSGNFGNSGNVGGGNRPNNFGNTGSSSNFGTNSGGNFGGDTYGSTDTTGNNGNYGSSLNTGNSAGVRPKPLNGQTDNTPIPAPAQHCVLSTTTVNGRPACKGYVIFEETFKTLDLRRWARDVRIPSHPDFEFCVFTDEPDTLWVHSDALHIRPKLTEDQYGEDFVRTGNLVLEGCTAGPTNAESCSRQAVFSYILPPALSGRINTKDSFRFRYGVVEIRAKLPLGDWLYPEILLLPYHEQYGPGISSGRVQLAMARGNRQLRTADGETQLSAKRLEYGVMAGTAMKILHRIDTRQWADQFHNYTLLWTPETMAFSVDGIELGIIRPESNGGLLRGASGQDPWANGDVMAPFDKEFYLSLGLAVGGVRTFPDDIVNGQGLEKPWGNTDAKAMLKFWNAKDQWYPTWGDKSQLIVQSIRVTALNH